MKGIENSEVQGLGSWSSICLISGSGTATITIRLHLAGMRMLQSAITTSHRFLNPARIWTSLPFQDPDGSSLSSLAPLRLLIPFCSRPSCYFRLCFRDLLLGAERLVPRPASDHRSSSMSVTARYSTSPAHLGVDSEAASSTNDVTFSSDRMNVYIRLLHCDCIYAPHCLLDFGAIT